MIYINIVTSLQDDMTCMNAIIVLRWPACSISKDNKVVTCQTNTRPFTTHLLARVYLPIHYSDSDYLPGSFVRGTRIIDS
jgi:hypothetical protein